jgi:hypothetical protein
VAPLVQARLAARHGDAEGAVALFKKVAAKDKTLPAYMEGLLIGFAYPPPPLHPPHDAL